MQSRKPPIYLLVILPIMGCGILVVSKIVSYYAATKGIRSSAIPNLTGILITLPVLFLWIPLTLLLSNIVLRVVPPLHRIAEGYVKRSGHPGFWKSQSQLLLLLVVMAIICVPIIIYGFNR